MAESTKNAHVLVVDDEEHITELVAMGLDFNGFELLHYLLANARHPHE
jgi:hypothetical protein